MLKLVSGLQTHSSESLFSILPSEQLVLHTSSAKNDLRSNFIALNFLGGIPPDPQAVALFNTHVLPLVTRPLEIWVADHPTIAQDARSTSPSPPLRVSSLNRTQTIVSYPPFFLLVQLHVLMFQLCYELVSFVALYFLSPLEIWWLRPQDGLGSQYNFIPFVLFGLKI